MILLLDADIAVSVYEELPFAQEILDYLGGPLMLLHGVLQLAHLLLELLVLLQLGIGSQLLLLCLEFFLLNLGRSPTALGPHLQEIGANAFLDCKKEGLELEKYAGKRPPGAARGHRD